MKTILKNAIESYMSSIAGCIVGMPEIIEGIITKDGPKFIKGLALLVIGVVSKEK